MKKLLLRMKQHRCELIFHKDVVILQRTISENNALARQNTTLQNECNMELTRTLVVCDVLHKQSIVTPERIGEYVYL